MDSVDSFELSKDQLIEHADKQMDMCLEDGGYGTTEKLALTCRILFDNAHDSDLAGQITARGADRATFYTQRLGLGFVAWSGPVQQLDFKIAYAPTRNSFRNVLVVKTDARQNAALRQAGSETFSFTIPR